MDDISKLYAVIIKRQEWLSTADRLRHLHIEYGNDKIKMWVFIPSRFKNNLVSPDQ